MARTPYRVTPQHYASQQLRKQHQTSNLSVQPMQAPKVVYRLSRQKIKRVPVTSCDLCRLRKLKCNSKLLPSGAICAQCVKNDTPCTFEDRDEVLQVPKARCSRARKSVNATTVRPFQAPRIDGQVSPSLPCDLFEIYSHRMAEMSAQTQQQSTSPAFQDKVTTLNVKCVYQIGQFESWKLPSTLSNPETGKCYRIGADHLVSLLVDRFFAEPSFCTVVVPDKMDFIDRFKKHGARPPPPSFLLHAVVACAAASSQSVETELQQWKKSIWEMAADTVHKHLSTPSGVELELIQALLLLSGNWPGDLACTERINAFDAAVGLATSIQLHQSVFLSLDSRNQAKRIALFWTMYCYDKVICSITGRQASISHDAHDMPYPGMGTFVTLGIHQSDVETAWIQRLTIAYISLCQILEEVHVHVAQLSQKTCLGYTVNNGDLPTLEARLEEFCKENRWFLSNLNSLPLNCRFLAEAVISQMHLTQLQLYLISLKKEVDSFTSQKIMFSWHNQKALAATIESAWHLVQQAPAVLDLHSCTTSLSDRPMTFSLSCALFGASYFRFLASRWAQWDSGKGCVMYAPWTSLDSQTLKAFETSPGYDGPHVGQHEEVRDETRNGTIGYSLSNESLDRLLPGTRISNDSVRKFDMHQNFSQTIVDQDGEASCDFVLPELNKDKPRSGRDATASAESSVLCTPARLLFQDDSRVQELLHSGSNDGSSSSSMLALDTGNLRRRNSYMKCEKSHAMLAPIEVNALEAFCNVADDDVQLGGVLPPFSAIRFDVASASPNASYVTDRWPIADTKGQTTSTRSNNVETFDCASTVLTPCRTTPRSMTFSSSSVSPVNGGSDAVMSLSRLIDQYSPFQAYTFAQRA